MTSPTPEQARASNPNASVWVAASAGTGKTFVLTNRVLRILLSGTRPEKILCLTFTKTAAAEMANRINERLGQWVVCDPQKLCEEIQGLTEKFPTEETQERARKLFAQVLEVPGGLKILTIHSFCQSLLGRFPLEAGIAPHFQVMDERTALEHLTRAKDAVLTEAQPDINPALASALAHICRKVAENTFAELIKELIGQRSGIERMMGRFQMVEQAVLVMGRMLELKPSDNRDRVIEAACREEHFNGIGLRRAVESLLTGSTTNQKAGDKMAIWLSAPHDRSQNYEDYKSVFLTKSGDTRKKLMPDRMAAGHPAEFEAMGHEAARLLVTEEKIKRLILRDNSAALLTIGAAMMAAFSDSKKRHAVMDYDDLILKVTGLMGQSGIADWVLYKLDGGIDHILIDEAQDTNPEQWQVVKTLANEFFTGAGSRQETRTIFAVGDVKQSIYSFQRADPKEFVNNRHMFEQKSSDAKHPFHNISLALSFRSTSAVLALVDRVFAAPESRMALSFSDEEIIHRPSRTGEAGLVELWSTEKADDEPADDDWQPPVIQQPSKSPEMKLAIRIADRIAGWLKDGEILVSQARPVVAGDIMILVRRRTRFDDYMIRALKARKIPVAGQDKMELSQQIAVMDLIAMGNFVLLPGDDLTLAVVLKSPFIGFDEPDLYDLAFGRRGSLWSALLSRKGEREIFRRAHDLLAACMNFADTVPPFEFYSNLLTTLGGRQNLIRRLGEEANDPIDEFLQLAMGYEQNNISSLQGFLSWVERGDVQIKRDMEQGQPQVRIMTIHGAKGLQAPIVILPDTCQVPTRGPRLLWAGAAPDQLMFWPGKKDFELGPCGPARDKINLTRDQEYQRLLYVAMTRAEDRLYITGWEGRKGRSDSCWYDQLRAALEAMDNVIEGEENYLLRLTCPQVKDAEKKTAPSKERHRKTQLPPWATAFPKSELSPARPLNPSRPTEEEPAVSSPLSYGQRKDQNQRRFHRGRLIHRLLEILPDLPEGSREDMARQFLGQAAYALGQTDIDQIIHQITGILTDAEFAQLFSQDSRAEVSIVGLVGTTAVSGQVDRLVVTDNQILIVDFKTNRPPPKKLADVARLYVRQMAAYRAVLSDIYPGKVIRCMLLWTDAARLMELPESVLAQVKF